jgi:hypothetical protein
VGDCVEVSYNWVLMEEVQARFLAKLSDKKG